MNAHIKMQAPVRQADLASAMTHKTFLAQDGKVWSARGTPGANPAMLLEIIVRYPGAVVLNALPIDEAVKLYNSSVPAC